MEAESQQDARSRIRRHFPRPETVLLLLAFVCTAGAKLVAVRRHQPPDLLVAWTHASSGDVVFFAAFALAITLAYALKPDRLVARLTLILSLVVFVWSAANAVWLLVTGIQLQPGIVRAVLRHPAEFWPTVRPHVAKRPAVFLGGTVIALAIAVWTTWRLVHPLTIAGRRRRYVLRATVSGALLMVSAAAQLRGLPHTGLGFSGQVLSFSSHSYALRSVVFSPSPFSEVERHPRVLPRVGQRKVGLPEPDRGDLPNVVIVMLESISHAVSALDDPRRDTMPTLARLASEGVEFVNTRVPVSQTGKAFWAVLSGAMPEIYPDYSEAVLVDEPYEGLPSLLRRLGYRSAFFEMSKGSFECAPGTFANFAFDWAWFRENLEDPSANLGYFSGDDSRMLDSAFEWAVRDDGPFLLMMMTSVAHDPYEVPEWFATPEENDYERYLQAVRYTDAFLAEVCQRLGQLGPESDHLLCVLGDHGDSFRADASRGRWAVYEELIRVPWVIHWPSHVAASMRCAWPCSQMDVTPTILSLLGCDIAEAGFDGRDALTPSSADRRLYFSAWFEGSPLGYVEGFRKRVYWPRSGKVVEYDLQADPGERSPISLAGPESDRVIANLMRWRQDSRIVFDARRFRERFLFEHWMTFCSGRYARAYYVP